MAQQASGTIAQANDTVSMSAPEHGCASIEITTNGTWNGTMLFEATTDGTNYINCQAVNVNTLNPTLNYTTQNATALFVLAVASFATIRVRCSSYVAGSATVTMQATAGAQAVMLLGGIPASANVLGATYSVNEIVYNGLNQLTVKQAAINATASGDNTILAGVSSKKIRILGICFTCSAAVDIIFKSASTTKISAMTFGGAGGGMAYVPGFWGWFMETAASEAFVMNLSLAANVRGSFTYVEV